MTTALLSSTFWSQSWTAALVNHLWQSTLVVAIAWVLFSLLIAAGELKLELQKQPIEKPATN